MQALRVPLQQFIDKVKDNGNSFLFSVLIFCLHENSSAFPCTCKPQPYCITYMVLPFLTITSLMLLTDPAFRRVWRYTTSKASCHFGLLVCRRVVKAVCVGSLWVVSVLIKADWYVCCFNPNQPDVAQLQCKFNQEVTDPEVVTIKEMELNSRMYGMALLLLIAAVAALLLPALNIFAKDSSGRCCPSRAQADELLLEVEEDILTQTIKEQQKEVMLKSLKSRVSKGEWVECFDVVEDFIGGKLEDDAEEKKKQDEEKRQKSAENQENNKTQDKGRDDDATKENTSMNVTGPGLTPEAQVKEEAIPMTDMTHKTNK